MSDIVLGHEFCSRELLAALGLPTRQVTAIRLDIEVGRPVRMEIELIPTVEGIRAVRERIIRYLVQEETP